MYLKARGRHLPAGGVYTQNVYVARAVYIGVELRLQI